MRRDAFLLAERMAIPDLQVGSYINIKPYQCTNREEEIRCAIEAGFFIDESDGCGDFSYFDL
jgi:hypothetical protein